MPPHPTIRVAVLGPVLVEGRAGQLIDPLGTMGKNLIVSLALARSSWLSTGDIVDDLWGDDPPRNERAALQTLVSRVRAVCADGILASATGGYGLAIGQDETDFGYASRVLARAQASAESGDHREAERESTRALEFWRGEPGVELGASPVAERLTHSAAALHSQLLRVRAASRIETGGDALADLNPLLTADPLDEELHLLRMRALAVAGRRNEAIRAFGELRERLADELGTSPSADLVAFHTVLLREENVETTSSPPASVRIGLRTAPNELLGRADDIAAIEQLLTVSRLTTILGPGGLGKTRLAQEIGIRAAEHTPAVIFVELASIRSEEDVPLAFASTLGIREVSAGRLKLSDPAVRTDLRTRLLTALSERPTLLIVDNCEHIVDAAAVWMQDILDSTSNVRILATSRSPISIGAERVYQLDSLASTTNPEHPGPAVSLFLERARAARPSAVLPLDAVGRLCERLDGLPLAIELAAARVRSMSVEEIERRLSNRFVLLTSGERAAPERHRTLLAVIDWSWNLLGDSERAMLRRLSRFPDGFGAEAAQFVAAEDPSVDVSDDLDALVNQSLVAVNEDPETGVLRYRMLETVREFGDMALTEAGEVQRVADAMYRWAVAFALETAPLTSGPEQIKTLHRISAEQDNLVTLLRQAIVDDKPDVALSIFSVLGYFWSLRGAHSEVVAFSAGILAVTRNYEVPEELADTAAASYSVLAATSFYGDGRSAFRALSRLRRISRDFPLKDARLAAMSELLLAAADPRRALSLLAEQRSSDNPNVACWANLISSQLDENDAEVDRAIGFASTAYELALRIEDTWAQGMAAQSLAQLHSQSGRPVEAMEMAERARTALIAIQASDDLRQIEWLRALAEVSLGRTERARPIFERFASNDEKSGGSDWADLRSIGLSGLAEVALTEGKTDEGVEFYRRAVASYTDLRRRAAPWFLISASAALATMVRTEQGAADVETLVRRLRIGVLISYRLRPAYIDKPVLGATSLGLAVWLLFAARPDADTDTDTDTDTACFVDPGLELLALTARLGSRQDLPSLLRSRYEQAAAECYGRERLEAAQAEAAKLTIDESAHRALDLIRSRVFLAASSLRER